MQEILVEESVEEFLIPPEAAPIAGILVEEGKSHSQVPG